MLWNVFKKVLSEMSWLISNIFQSVSESKKIQNTIFHKCQVFNRLDFIILTKKGVMQKVLTNHSHINLSFSHRQAKGINLLLLITSIGSEQNIIRKIIQMSWNVVCMSNF